MNQHYSGFLTSWCKRCKVELRHRMTMTTLALLPSQNGKSRVVSKVFSCTSAFSRCMLFSGILGMLLVWRQAPETEELFNPFHPHLLLSPNPLKHCQPRKVLLNKPRRGEEPEDFREQVRIFDFRDCSCFNFWHPLGFTVSSSLLVFLITLITIYSDLFLMILYDTM